MPKTCKIAGVDVANVRLKRSFNAALSSSSYTLYALLPTLSEQLNERYDVEAVSAELQNLSASQSTVASSTATPAASQVLEQPVEEPQPVEDLKPASGQPLGPGESWASEFRSDASEGTGTDLHMSVSELDTEPETDDQVCFNGITANVSLPTRRFLRQSACLHLQLPCLQQVKACLLLRHRHLNRCQPRPKPSFGTNSRSRVS